ncbi:MAG: hypothetical protein U0791_13320 [Gemmataceae bacterium]
MTALLALIGLSLAPSPPQAMAEAERQYAAGVAARENGEVARTHFAEAARLFDSMWANGIRNPDVAKNRARSHRLAGNLPAAISSLHDGLAIARYDRELQVELEEARDAVEYAHADMAAACRPAPLRGIGTRMSPLEAFLISGGLWFAACLCAARYAMTRVPGWWMAAVASASALALLGTLLALDHRRRAAAEERPLVIVNREQLLKSGNGDSWPDRLKWKLPAGAEAHELGRRGGWIQIELANGAAGWIPESAAIR